MRKLIFPVIVCICITNTVFGQWTTSGSNIYNSNTGNVGIGTTTPRTALDVGGGVQISGTNSTTPSTGVVYGFFPYSGVGLGIYSSATSPNQGIGIWTNPGGTQKEAIRILSGGNVGIGTTSPTAPLNVVSAAGVVTMALNTVGGLSTDSQYLGVNGRCYFGYDGTRQALYLGDAGPNSTSNKAIVFDANNAECMRILANGNVAIGTTDPKGYKLAVNGSAIATSMVVKLNANWPDYVFNPTYKLIPLSELKTYIDENNHLPNVPSAADIEKNGQDLGELNKILLKKVEELTLYMIEKDKQVNEQKELNALFLKEINDLKTQIKEIHLNK